MIILHENEILTTTITANSENPNAPLSNLLDSRVVKYYRAATDTGLRIVFNKTDLAATWFFVLNHNISSGATITLEANTSDSWGSPAFSESVTHNTETMSLNFDLATYDYWSLYVDDPTNTNGFIQIGLCVLGTVYTMPGANATIEITHHDTSQNNVSTSGQLTGNIRYKYTTVKADFESVPGDDMADIVDIYIEMGIVKPFILCVWENSLNVQGPIYSFFVNDTLVKKMNPTSGLTFNFGLDFQEVF